MARAIDPAEHTAQADAPRTAFVLGGGASLGAMQAGMVRALYESGITPDILVGTSAGALNAAFLASRPPTVATAEELAHVWRGPHREDIFPINARMVIGGLANHRDHLVPDTGMRRLAGRHLQFTRLEHAPTPLHLVTFDLASGEEVRLSDGPALEAVLAAAAIPGVLPPVRRGERLLVDGGVVNNTPISHAVELGAEVEVRPVAAAVEGGEVEVRPGPVVEDGEVEVRPAAAASEETEPRPPQPAPSRAGIGRRVATVGLLVALGISLLLSVPGLRPVANTIEAINPAWVALAIALELASCISFVIVFRLFFDRVRGRDARALAWTSMASGALLPGGGVGGYAIGGWLVYLTGAPTRWIVRRSSGLFFFTTGINSIAVITAGLLLVAGVSGPHDFARSALPVILAGGATAVVLALPVIGRRRGASGRLEALIVGISDAWRVLLHPSWRLLGAIGYLGFDIAVLWVAFTAVGQPPSVPALVLGYTIGYLANSAPIPGGIGVLDAGLAGALLLYGAAPGHVVAAVLVYHAIAFWIPSLGGVIAYARLRPRLTDHAGAGSDGAAEAPICG